MFGFHRYDILIKGGNAELLSFCFNHTLGLLETKGSAIAQGQDWRSYSMTIRNATLKPHSHIEL